MMPGCQNARMLVGWQCQRCCLCFSQGPKAKVSTAAALFARTNLGLGVLVLGPWSFVLLAPTSIIVKCSEAFCQLQTSIAISLLPDEIKAQLPPFYLAFSSLFLFLHDFSSFLLFSLIFSTFSLQHPFGQHAFSPRFFAFFAIATFPMCESVCELCIYPWQGLLQRVESQRKQKVLFAQFSFS